MDELVLPDGFQDLVPFLGWALPTEAARCARRQASTFAELDDFYHSMLARMGEILLYLNQFSDDNAPAEVERLFLLSLSLAEVAPAIENFQQASVPDGHDVFRFIPMALYPESRKRQV